jgi:hypothetical protein
MKVAAVGKVPALPANIRLDWKKPASDKLSSLFCCCVSDEEKSFTTSTPGSTGGQGYNPGVNIKKLFCP